MTTLEIAAPEFVKRFQAGEIPFNARVTVVYQERNEPQNPALSLIEDWLAQAPTDATSIREAEEDLAQIQGALNANREQAGARLLFPTSPEL